MSLRYTRDALISSNRYVCLHCRLQRIQIFGPRRPRFQHTEAAIHAPSDNDEAVSPALKTEPPQPARFKHEALKTQQLDSSHLEESSRATRSGRAAQPATEAPKPSNTNATELQEALQRQFAEHRRQINPPASSAHSTEVSVERRPSKDGKKPDARASRGNESVRHKTKLSRRERRRRKRHANASNQSRRENVATVEKKGKDEKSAATRHTASASNSDLEASISSPKDQGSPSIVSTVQQESPNPELNKGLAMLPPDVQNMKSKLEEHVKTHATLRAQKADSKLSTIVEDALRAFKGTKTSNKKAKPQKPAPKVVFRKLLSTKKDDATGHEAKGITTTRNPKAKKLQTVKPASRVASSENVAIEVVKAAELEIKPIEVSQPPVPTLTYGLDRVLFNPGVYHIQDPRSRVYNFDPYLQKIMPVSEFDFDALKAYVTSSRDETLSRISEQHGKRYSGSSSSMTGMLAHFHFLLSQWRQLYTDMLSREFPAKDIIKNFTLLQRAPCAVFLRWKDGHYAIDADKEFDGANILMMLGKSMEKLLTLNKDEFERYRKSNPDQVPDDERNAREAYHYSTMGDLLMRSQLDAHDPRLPGSGMFDLKTRAVAAVRMDAQQPERGMDYEIRTRQGAWESYEREYFDMIRSAFLKYSLQVRMGRMDGIFVAFHNTQRIFGFQYISCPEMDSTLHGQWDTTLGDQEFKLSLDLLNRVLDRATKKYPEQSLRLHFETRDAQTPFMYIFAEPVTEEQIEELQATNRVKIQEFERNALGLHPDEVGAEDSDHDDGKWADMQADVEEEMEKDETSLTASDVDDGSVDQDVADAGLALKSSQSHSEGPLWDKTHIGDADEDPPTACQEDEIDQNNESRGVQQSSQNSMAAPVEDQNLESGNAGNGATTLHEFDKPGDEAASNLQEDINGVGSSSGETVQSSQHADDKASIQDSPRMSDIEIDTQSHEQPVNEPLPNAGRTSAPVTGTDCSQSIGDGDESSSSAAVGSQSPSDQEKEEEEEEADIKRATDESSSDTHGKEKTLPEPTGEVLAMTLTIRNKVNNKYVIRPEKLIPEDTWTVEYALADVKSPSKAWSLYQASQHRRQKQLEVSDDDDSNTVDWYIRRLRELSQKGKAWREQQDRMDKTRPKIVLREPWEKKDGPDSKE